jgi:hypothetical protein
MCYTNCIQLIKLNSCIGIELKLMINDILQAVSVDESAENCKESRA